MCRQRFPKQQFWGGVDLPHVLGELDINALPNYFEKEVINNCLHEHLNQCLGIDFRIYLGDLKTVYIQNGAWEHGVVNYGKSSSSDDNAKRQWH